MPRDVFHLRGQRKNRDCRYIENMKFSGYRYYIVLLLSATIVASAVSYFTVFKLGINPNTANTVVSQILPKYTAGQNVGGIWRFDRLEIDNQDTHKYFFKTRSGNIVQLHFAHADKTKPCFTRTTFFNVMYESSKNLTPYDVRTIHAITKEIKRKEGGDRRIRFMVKFFNIGNLRLVPFLILLLFLFDVMLWAGGWISSDMADDTATRHVPRLYRVLDIVILVLLFSRILNAVRWNYVELSDYSFFKGWNYPDRLVYVLNDTGMPAVPFRFLLSLMAQTGSIVAIQMMSVLIEMAAVVLVYLIVRRYARRPLVWVTLLALALNSVFIGCFAETRGYPLFIAAVLLSMYMFDTALRKPHPLFFWICIASQWVAVASNPVTVVVFGAMAAAYLFGLRRQLSVPLRRVADIHYFVLAIGFLALAPLALGATVFHIKDTNAIPFQSFSGVASTKLFLLANAIIFILLALRYRKDYRASYFLAASFGILTTLALIEKHILKFSPIYFLFVTPLIYINCAVLVESFLRLIESRSKRICQAAVATLTAAFVIFFGLQVGMKSLLGIDYLTRSDVISHVTADAISSKMVSTPVLILPKDAFFIYLHDIQHYNPFDRNLLVDPNFQQFYSPQGETMFHWKNIYTPIENLRRPAKFFGGAFTVFFFPKVTGRSLDSYISTIGDCNCRLVKLMSEHNVVEMDCTPLRSSSPK